MADETPQPTGGTPVSTTEATNANMLNQVMGKLLDAGSSSSAAVITALGSIASAITASIIGGTTGTTANRVLVAKGTTGRALQATPVTISPSTGDTDFNGADIVDVDSFAATSGAFSTTLTKGGANVAIATQTVGASFTFAFPENGSQYLILNFPFAWTITQTNAITLVGTSTVTVTNAGVGDLTANSASTVISTQAQSSNNVVPISGSVVVTFASTSGDCAGLCLTIWGTRALAS